MSCASTARGRRAARTSVAGCARRPSPAASGVVRRLGLRPLESGEGFARWRAARASGGVRCVVQAAASWWFVRAAASWYFVRAAASFG
jgi:hypothetical protein